MPGYTKRDVVMAALTELGVATSGVSITSTELADSCGRLDMMMASWDSKGIHLGYPIIATTPVDPGLETNIPALALEAVVTNLAVKLAPMFGKQVQAETAATAMTSLTTLQGLMTTPPPLGNRSGTPAGAGNWRSRNGSWWRPFLPTPPQTVTTGDTGSLGISTGGGTNDIDIE